MKIISLMFLETCFWKHLIKYIRSSPKSPPTKYNISHDWGKFNNQSFLQNFEKMNLNQVLQLNQNNFNITFENYLNTANTLINSHAPLKKLNKKQRKFQQKLDC